MFSGFRWILAFCPLLLPVLLPAGSIEQVEARVVAMDREAATVRLELPSGEIVEGVRITPGDAAIDYTGRTVQGTLNQRGETPRLDTIYPLDGPRVKAMGGANRGLIREAAGRGRGEILARGDYWPEVALFDEDGEVVFGREFKQQPTVVAFIFTRCNMPNMCPATSQRMVRLSREVEEAGIEGVRFALVSFDPEYDSPGILRQYADSYGMDREQFDLLTGPPEAIDALLRTVGIRVLAEDGTLNHNMAAFLLDDHGRVVLREDGSLWSPEAMLQQLQRIQG
jgi:protein SCO1/2